jgi:hypothetical protein
MTGPRIFIIILVLLGVLFIVGAGIGLHQNDAQPEPKNRYSPPEWTSSLDWISPSLDLTTVQAVPGACVQAAQKTFKVAARSNCTLRVPAASQKYRKVKLHLVTGAVQVTYLAPNNDPNLENPQRLSWPPTGNNKDPQSLVVLDGGGSIALACGSGPPCVLQMQ